MPKCDRISNCHSFVYEFVDLFCMFDISSKPLCQKTIETCQSRGYSRSRRYHFNNSLSVRVKILEEEQWKNVCGLHKRKNEWLFLLPRADTPHQETKDMLNCINNLSFDWLWKQFRAESEIDTNLELWTQPYLSCRVLEIFNTLKSFMQSSTLQREHWKLNNVFSYQTVDLQRQRTQQEDT